MSYPENTTIKEARQAFKNHDYTDAIEKCKKILEMDQNNYEALTLLAATMLKIDEYKSEIPLILEKAIQIDTNNLLAWQGLIAYYTKYLDHNDSYNKLILIYCKLLRIESDAKFPSILNKISELALQIKDVPTLTRCIKYLSKLRKKLDENKLKMLDKMLWQILIDNFNNMDKYTNLLKSIFKSVINDIDPADHKNFYTKYLKILYNKGELITLIKEALNIHQQFPQDILPLEYICRVYYEQDTLDENFIDIDIPEFFQHLLKLDKNSEVAVIAKVAYLRKSDNLFTAREILKQMFTLKPNSVYGLLELSKISIKLNCWEDAEVAARQILEIKHGIKDELLYQMQLIALESISRSSDKHKWEIALHECEQHLKVRPSTQLHLIHTRISILLNKSDAYILLNNLESQHEIKMEASILRALYLKQNKQFDEAVNILQSNLETSEAWLLLGLIYWEMTEYNYSLMAFLNGVKADHYNWECLIYLGHYYQKYGNDLERSRRCYQTALKINPNSEEAGIGLSTAYRLLKNQDANMKLLQVLTTQGSGPKWAWLQLGLQYLDQGNAEQAIKTFQRVVRADPNNCRCWELLADAYFMRGAYTSALKTYQKALELCPESLYSMMRLANIKLAIGEYDNAKKDFECILTGDSYYIPALKGLAEVCLTLANYYTAKQLFSHANDYLQKAMDSLATAIKVRRDVSCIWKLLGDVYYKAALLPEKYSYLNVSSIPVQHENIGNIVLVKQRSMITLSIKCYRSAISLCPQLSSLWHDLAVCYLTQLRYYPRSSDKSVVNECLDAIKYAVQLCPSVWMHWNLLGVVCMLPFIKNYALAQHSFIMAIDKDFNNSVAWSNLGTLYLHIGCLYKANAAYSRAQTANPAYINCWTGQSLIAEMMRKGEAMDLFRHATQLGYHSQAAIGYTHYLLQTILNSSVMYDSSVSRVMKNDYPLYDAADVMTWYIEYHPNDCHARNAYGLLLERLKLYKSAAEQFVKAVSISGNDEKDLIRINLARVLIRIKKYREAIKTSQTLTNANFNSNCHLALALFKAAQYVAAYDTYEATLSLFADTDTKEAYILYAMASIAYTYERVDDAKTLLFQCIQIKTPVITGLLAAASLGILHNDKDLTALVLKDLKFYKNHSEYGCHVVNIFGYSHMVGNNAKSAIINLSKSIYMYPDDVRYWILLLKILQKTDLKTFSKCAQKVLRLNKDIATGHHPHIACALSINSFSQILILKNIRSVQKLLFTYPDHVESWAMFVATFLLRSTIKNCNVDIKWISRFITIIQQNYQTTNSMTKWLNDSKMKLNQIN